ncbi:MULTISPECIES: hypothetical protein [Sorangium]|uniref:hypothetical protein n=1 Tax=Sorangium TaxID=39643 RepID=UPI001A936A7D|nr:MULTISPECIES: hypothetical protein [Sorangium]
MEKSGVGVPVVSPPPAEPEELELLEDELELLEDELELLEDELELLEDELELLEDELELELEDEELLEDDELLEDPVVLVSSPQPASATDANASMNQREDQFCCEIFMDAFRDCLLTIVVM